MESVVDEIKKRIDIAEFIGSFVTLKKAGKNYKACCPFHSEKTPSFMVSPDRGLWKCFGACQDGGDVISFLMKWENITFSEAIRELALKAGIKIEKLPMEDRQWKEKEKLMLINELAAKYFHYILTKHPLGKPGMDYVTKRGLNSKMLETFLIGYAPQSWDSLTSFLRKKKFKEEDIVESGLAVKNDSGRVYDRFRGRLMFPIINARHEILGFSGRLLAEDARQAKYVNTPETPLYHKRETLFGMHVAHETIRKEDVAILVEGEFDMLTSFKHDIKNTVAVKGSAVTRDQLMLLKRYTKHVILALDADFSGAETTLRAIKDAEAMDFRIDVIQFDFGKDPDEALQKDPIAYKKLLKKPQPIYDFILNTALKRFDPKDPYGKKEIVNSVLPFIQTISNPIVKGHYMKRLADLLDVHEADISSMGRLLEKDSLQKKVHSSQTTFKKKEDRYSNVQKYILASLVQHDNPHDYFIKISSQLSAEDFLIPSFQDIFTYFTNWKDSGIGDLQNFIATFPDPLQAVLDELFLVDLSESESPDISTSDKSLVRTILELKQFALRFKIKEALQSEDQKDTIAHLTKNLADVEKELRIM